MTTEQTDADFAAIERARDLPPDEPYGDREADYWDDDEELHRISTYGACLVCGRGRTVKTEIRDRASHMSLVCPEGHPQP